MHVDLLNLAKDDESFPPLISISPSLDGDCISVGMFCDKYIFMVLLNFRQLKLCTWPPLLKMANVHKN